MNESRRVLTPIVLKLKNVFFFLNYVTNIFCNCSVGFSFSCLGSCSKLHLRFPTQRYQFPTTTAYARILKKSIKQNWFHLQTRSSRINTGIKNCNQNIAPVIIWVFCDKCSCTRLLFRQNTVNRELFPYDRRHFSQLHNFASGD